MSPTSFLPSQVFIDVQLSYDYLRYRIQIRCLQLVFSLVKSSKMCKSLISNLISSSYDFLGLPQLLLLTIVFFTLLIGALMGFFNTCPYHINVLSRNWAAVQSRILCDSLVLGLRATRLFLLFFLILNEIKLENTSNCCLRFEFP